MIRIPLKNDCCYKLKGNCHEKEYRIVSHIGSGANTLVYIAEKENHFGKTERCILKEFYPERVQLSRCEDGNLTAKDPESFKKLKTLFYSKNVQIAELSACDDVHGSFSVCHINDFLYGNGTLCTEIPIESYKTYAEINNETLIDMLKATCDLCAIVGALHDFGYLHLDLKPSNLLCVEHSYNQKSSRLLKFLDLDTAVKKEKLYSGDFSFSYSEGYSAPEQKQFNIAGISEKTDIFSIGAILFERIFGYLPSFDDMKSDAEFVFEKENKLFFGVNACFYNELSDFFKKTICCNPDNRFDSCIGDGDSVMEAVEKLIVLAENRASVSMYKVKDYFCPKCLLVDEGDEPANDYLFPTVEIVSKKGLAFCETSLLKLLKRAFFTENLPLGLSTTKDLEFFQETKDYIHASAQNCRFILTGTKESGKSFSLKKLYNDLRDNKLNSAPMYINANELAETESVTNRILTEYFKFGNISGVELQKSELEKVFSDIGKTEGFPAYTLLVDGLNEVTADKRKSISEELNSFSIFKNLCVIVASTNTDGDLNIAVSSDEISATPGSFVEIRINPLSQSQIKNYIAQRNPVCAHKIEENSLYKILGGNIKIIKMISELNNIEYIRYETDIIKHYLSRVIAPLQNKITKEVKVFSESDCFEILRLISKKMLEYNTNVIYPDTFKELTASEAKETFDYFAQSGLFKSINGGIKLSSSVHNYIIADILKDELEKLCSDNISPSPNLLIGSHGFNLETLKYLCELTRENDMLAHSDNGRIISDKFVQLISDIESKRNVCKECPEGLLTFAFSKISNCQYKQIKAMAAVNILKAMQIARNSGLFEEEQKLLKLQSFNADFSCIKQDVYATAYYNEIKAFIGRKVSVRNMVNAILFPVSAALIMAFVFFYALPHFYLKPPEIEVSASYDYPSETISDWSEYSFTIVDVNGTNTIARSSLILESAFEFSGFSGEIILDKIIDSNHATMKLKVDKITDTECFVYLKDGTLESIGDYNTFESNKGKTLFTFDTEPNTQSPIIGLSINGVKYSPSYNTGISVNSGDIINVKAIAPTDNDSIEYIKYKIGKQEIDTVYGDDIKFVITDDFQSFSLQVLARTKNGNVNKKWLNYNIYVLPIAPPTVEVRVNDVLLSPFDENLTIKPGDYIRVTAVPSVSTGSDIAYIEYKFGKEDIQTVYESDVLLRVEESWTELYFQTRVTDVDGNQMPQASRFLFTVES